MAEFKATYHSSTFECPWYIFNRYNDLDHERLGIKSPVGKIFSLLNENDDYELDENNESVINRELSVHIASNLLVNDCNLPELSTSISQKIKRIELDYNNVMEEFSLMLNRWLKLRKGTIVSLQQSEQKFRLIHRITTGMTFVSSTVEFAVRFGLILRNMFYLRMELPLIVPVLNGISITTSLLACSYSRTILQDIAKELGEEKRRRRDLDRLYRKGKWIDTAVQDLFPFGIDINLLKDPSLQKQSWRLQVCSAIILTNIKKDMKILDYQDFLPTVKAFIESPAAQIWLNRMKLRKLLDIMSSKCKTLSHKRVTSGSEVFLNRAAINLYPVFFPLLLKTGNTEKLRFIFSSITSVKTAMDLADSGADEFQQMRDTASALKEEYVKIRKLSNDLISDYD